MVEMDDMGHKVPGIGAENGDHFGLMTRLNMAFHNISDLNCASELIL